MSFFFLLHLLLIVVTSFAVFGEGGNHCRESRCKSNGPSIHFPFRLQHQPDHCGYPGFELSCHKNKTILTLSNSLTLVVDDIDYASQKIDVILWKNCLVNLLYFNFSASPFLLWNAEPFPLCNYSIFNCSSDYIDEFGCSATPNSELIAVSNTDNYDRLQGCKKIDEIPSLSCSLNNGNVRSIPWLNPKCGYCEDHGMDCSFNNYTKQLGIHCFNRPVTTKGGLKEPLIAGGVLGIALFGIIIMALYEFYSSNKIERENQARVETFLEDYRALRPTRYTYADIKKITILFQEILGEGAYGVVYKGTLSNEIHVAVKVFNDSEGNGEEFINEVAAMGKIHHVNVVRLVGFCADGVRRALVFEYLPNQSLDKLIFPGTCYEDK